MNYEYSSDELKSYDITILTKILIDYNLPISRPITKSKIIRQILNYQINNFEPFNNLPADILRLLGLYLPACDIIKLCRLDEKMNNIICHNKIFLRELGHQRLTDNDDRLIGKNVLKDVNDRNIIYAVRNGYLKRIKYLMSIPKFREYFRYAMTTAAENGYLDIVEYLISRSPKDRRPVSGFSDNKKLFSAVLVSASKAGQLEIVKYLISQGANVHENNDKALKLASMYGHLNTVRYLIENGADVHVDDDKALRNAVVNGHLDVVKYLVEHDADIHALGESALQFASMHGYSNIVKYLRSIN